jgi:hypothetical protein
VHEELAAALAGAEGEEAEEAEGEADPGGDESGGMKAAGAEVASQAESYQECRENQCYFCHGNDTSGKKLCFQST